MVESIKQKFTLFSPEGVPLRATLTLSLREYKTLDEQLEQLNLSSPDRTHAHVARAGDTLAGVAARYYERPGEWRAIADARTASTTRAGSTAGALPRQFRRCGEAPWHAVTLADESRRPARLLRAAVRGADRGRGAAARRAARRHRRSPTRTTSRRSTASSSRSTTGTPTTRRFKYVGAETAADLEGSTRRRRSATGCSSPCNKQVELRDGLRRRPATLMLGAPSPRWSRTSPRAARRRWRCAALNVLHQLRAQAVQPRPGATSATARSRRTSPADRPGPRQEPEALPDADRDRRRGARAGETPSRTSRRTNQYDIDFLLVARASASATSCSSARAIRSDGSRRAQDAPLLRPVGRRASRARATSTLRAALGRVADRLQADADDREPGQVGDRERAGTATKKKAITGEGVARRQGARPSTRTCTSC